MVVVVFPLDPDRDGSGQIVTSGKAAFSALRVGDCFTGSAAIDPGPRVLKEA
ncbi:hypothetical protein [Actinomadura sp. 6N118]|uniref:hypothetical protein n=1 Tax=Actinomadura sp. 6N118 TaxID=3375151 RepID=UPI0037A40F93